MLGMDKWFHPTLYLAYDSLSILGLELHHVSKRGPLFIFYLQFIFFQTLVCQPITSADNGIDVDIQPTDSRVLGMDGHAHAFRNANVNWADGAVQQSYNMNIDISVHLAHFKYLVSNTKRGIT